MHRILILLIGLVWLLNGIWAKLLGGVPRHEAIVARFFGNADATIITPVIGISEAALGIWWLAGYQRRTNALLQLVAIIGMNTLESIYASDLLLWGRWNAAWSALLCVAIAYTAFFAPKKRTAYVIVS
ncbi:MAG: hypothetical protein EOO15_23420 [Chitinophagaceae bacterium]|nr:MAG: hypothetical protein EOO15_23420 [Chitinophagaceae bacterium]